MPGGSKIPINSSARSSPTSAKPDYRGAVLSNWLSAADVLAAASADGMCPASSPGQGGASPPQRHTCELAAVLGALQSARISNPARADAILGKGGEARTAED